MEDIFLAAPGWVDLMGAWVIVSVFVVGWCVVILTGGLVVGMYGLWVIKTVVSYWRQLRANALI